VSQISYYITIIVYAARSQIYIHCLRPLRYEKFSSEPAAARKLIVVADSLYKLVTFIVYKIRRYVSRSGASSRRAFSTGAN